LPEKNKSNLPHFEISLADKTFVMKKKLICIFSYVVLVILITISFKRFENLQKNHFVETQQIKSRELQSFIERRLSLMYQGLRTISRMPGVIKMDLHGHNLTPDARQSIQEIYNNLNLNIHMSEVYIVPINLNPDKIDPRTKKMEAPPVTFDKILGKNIKTDLRVADSEDEIEIYEYREMEKHNTWLKKNYPNENLISGFDIPMLSGKEVITCDNSHFDLKHPDDKRRSGQVFSVPFYDQSGKLKGTIVGVILTDVIKKYLPNAFYHIENTEGNYTVGAMPDINKKLIFQEKSELNFKGPIANWYLVTSIPEDEFYKSHDMQYAKFIYYIILVLTLIIVAVICVMIEQNAKLIDSQIKALESTAKLATMGEMTAGIAHEINNPLSIIVTKVTVMNAMNEKGTLAKERITTDLEKLKSTADRIAKIIKGLKSLSRNSEGDPLEKVKINKIIQESLEFCEDRLKQRGIELRLNNKVEAEISCKEVQVSQVIINLVNNSSDAIMDLPEKWIEIDVATDLDKNKIRINLTDSGKGIPPEIAEKLMTAFFSTKGVGKGTGLGLSISKKIITEHGGDFYLDQSHPNTRFVIELPIS
jgi:signal transduction histidine kinase